MRLSVLTFNLEYNLGFPKLMRVLARYKPDIVALQEFQMSKDSIELMLEKGYTLAAHAESFKRRRGIFSVATFYKADKVHLQNSTTIFLPRGLYEMMELLFNGFFSQRLVISTNFTVNNKNLALYNVHFSPYTANTLRNKQLTKTLKNAYTHKAPTIILGDFNYPYNRSNLEKLFTQYEFQEATTNIFHTFYKSIRFLPIRFKLDYIFYRNINNIITKRIDAFTTDHTPIIATFEI